MPNVEIELKYKIDDPDAVIKKLDQIDAKYVKEFRCIDTYFLVPDNAEGRKYLRVREKGDKKELAYHFVPSYARTDEWEMSIDDAKMAKEILQKIGHDIDVVVDKKRRVYIYGDSEIVIDEVVDLGNFIEIESPSISEVEKIEKLFGFKKSDRLDKCGYPDMIRERLINK
ncbi:MAG: class IV adenylate cyclase [Patescibacteria group bacterium]